MQGWCGAVHKERGWEPRRSSDGTGAAGPGRLLPSSQSTLRDKLRVPHPCQYSRPGWMRPGPSGCSGQHPSLQLRVGTGWPLRSLPTQPFCDSMTVPFYFDRAEPLAAHAAYRSGGLSARSRGSAGGRAEGGREAHSGTVGSGRAGHHSSQWGGGGGCGEEPSREEWPEAAAPASEPPLRAGLGALERYRPRANAPSSAEPAGRRLSEQLSVCCATGSWGKRACEETGCSYSCFSSGTERCGTPRRGRPAMRHRGLGCAPSRRSAPLRPGHTDPRLHAFAAPRENAPRIPGGAPLLPAAPPRTDHRRSRRHLIPAAPPPHWPSAPPRGPAPPGLPVTIGWRRYRLATIGRFERATDDPRVEKRTHAPRARSTMGVVGGSGRSEHRVRARDCGLLAAPGEFEKEEGTEANAFVRAWKLPPCPQSQRP